MGQPDIDYGALFRAAPSPCLVLDPDLVIADVNDAAARIFQRIRTDLLGRHIGDVLSAGPAGEHGDGADGADGAKDAENAEHADGLGASLARVLASGEAETLPVQRFGLTLPGQPAHAAERWWSLTHIPLRSADGTVAFVMVRVEDVTELVGRGGPFAVPGRLTAEERRTHTELLARFRDVTRQVDALRQAHGRERQIGLALQETMLHCPDLAGHPDVAVRYLPATELNVCGDWYDLVDLSGNRYTAAVGDVVGHGLQAAAVMGMLRSALSAAMRAIETPGVALEILGRYASSIEHALGTTVVKVLIDRDRRLISYSSAGHPPPVLAHADGTCTLLDQATQPPLGARAETEHRPQAHLTYAPGDTLVLYTDGLIERRGEVIDAGLHRLTASLARHRTLSPEKLADTVLADLGVADGGPDDVALMLIRL